MQQHTLNNKINIPFAAAYAQQQYLSAEEGILCAKNENCDYWYIDGSIDSEIPEHWTKKRIDGLLKLIEAYSVKPIFHGNFKSPLASDVDEVRKASIAYTKKEIDLASWLNAPLILHGGVVVEPRLVRKVKKIALENYLCSVSELLEYAQKREVPLYLENLCNYKNYKPFHYIFTHMEEIEYILTRLADVCLFLDVGHANVCDGNPAELIKQYHQRIIGMSFSNNDGERDQHFGLDKGNIDYTKIVKTILDVGWKGIVGFETRGKTTQESIADLNTIYQKIIVCTEA
jgi:L-ribulose-5-phosphate 3-epimerase